MTRLGVTGLLAIALPAADLAPERIPLPEISCTAPDAAPFEFPKIGHDRHAVLVVESAGCSGTLLAGKQALGRVAEGGKPARFDFAEQLRLAVPPPLGFRPAEAGFGEIRLRLELMPRVYFHGLRYSAGVLTLTARNTLDNTADLFFRVEGEGRPALERADNLGPNLEREYSFAVGPVAPGGRVKITMEKAPEALEPGYRYADLLRVPE